jgi:hypothetical protein
MQTNFSPFNNRFITEWQEEDVLSFVKGIGLDSHIHYFQNNHINGYDLCNLTSDDIINELKITKLHFRNVLTKAIKECILDQCI